MDPIYFSYFQNGNKLRSYDWSFQKPVIDVEWSEQLSVEIKLLKGRLGGIAPIFSPFTDKQLSWNIISSIPQHGPPHRIHHIVFL